LKILLIIALAGCLCAAASGKSVEIKPPKEWLTQAPNGDWVVDNGHYLLKFAKQHGYAGVEVRIFAGSGDRLDQYWTPELTFHAMCRFFDNVSFMDAEGGEIQGYLTMENTFVEAEAETIDGQPALVQKGHLQRRKDHAKGQVYFEKTMIFYEDHYEVELSVGAPEGSKYRYADVWFDINDDWCHRYTNSAGDILRLRPSRGDAQNAAATWRSIEQLDRGYGVWMSVSGPREEILIALTDPEVLRPLPYAGITFFDGHDEVGDQPPNSSHECMSITIVGGIREPVAFEPNRVIFHYRVFLQARSDFERLYGTD